MSVGLEDTADIIEDLEQALKVKKKFLNVNVMTISPFFCVHVGISVNQCHSVKRCISA